MPGSMRIINGTQFRPFRIVNPGENLYFTSGRMVAVETWAVEWGKHEFDYELNSRPLDPRGRPQAIATTREALEREFLERRVVSRYPVPVSFALNGTRRLPTVEMTYGEARPQVYTSRVDGGQVAWSLHFRSHQHHGAVGGKRASQGRNMAGPGPSGMGRAEGLATGFNYLMVYLPVNDHGGARPYPNGFGVTDLIGREPTMLERWTAWITGG
jgi:hypothetical protein